MSLTFEIHVLFYRIYKPGFMCNPVPLPDPDHVLLYLPVLNKSKICK